MVDEHHSKVNSTGPVRGTLIMVSSTVADVPVQGGSFCAARAHVASRDAPQDVRPAGHRVVNQRTRGTGTPGRHRNVEVAFAGHAGGPAVA